MTSNDAKQQAEAAARLVRDGVADSPTAVNHVLNENAGRDLARRLNAQRGTAPQQPQKPQEGKKS